MFHYYGFGPGMMGWGWGFGSLISLVFWIIFALIIVSFIRGGRRHWHDGEDRNTPLDILKERYAKGEITKEEFEKMKKDLS